MKKALILAMALVMLAGFAAYAQQTVPPLISYQGMLTDANGNPMTGTKKLTFNIYGSATGTDVVWGPQVFDGVPLIGGRFNVILGSTDTAGHLITNAFSAKDRYLGIKVDSNAEIAPRQQILTTPFAVQAEHAKKADSASEAEHAAKADVSETVKGLPAADYDSGWFYVQPSKNYDYKHNLGTLPRLAVIWGACDNQGHNMLLMDSIYAPIGSTHAGYGSWLQRITTDSYRISTGVAAFSGYGVDTWYNGWDCGVGTNGYIRVFMWK